MRPLLFLLRGINVGGKNKVPMAELRALMEELGFTDVRTYIASGNAIAKSPVAAKDAAARLEAALPERFRLDSAIVRVLALTPAQLRSIVDKRPPGFGDSPDTYHSDAIFLIDVTAREVMPAFDPREGVDAVWPGRGVIYSQRRSAERTKSRLGKIASSPHYKSLTIRSWQTTVKLLELIEDA